MSSLRLKLSGLALSATLAGCAGMTSWEQPSRGASAPAPKVRPERMVGPGEVMVRSGDTMYAIAFRNNLDYREVARWNGIGSDYMIRPGQILRLKPPRSETRQHYTGEIRSNGFDDAQKIAPRPITADTPVPAIDANPAPRRDGPVEPGLATVRYNWIWPTEGPVIRGFGQQSNKGLDFTGSEGQAVFAAAPGRVVYSGNALQGYGELIIIKHDDVLLSAYGYNRARHVKEGDVVTAGQRIAEMGLGPESKPLLHFEIRDKGQPSDPAARLPARAGTR